MIRLAPAAAVILATSPALANDAAPKMQEYYQTEIATWANNPVLIEAVRTQNETTDGYSQDQIDTLDQTWRSQVGLANPEMIEPVLNNAAAEFLRQVVTDAGGTITEVFIMDAQGLNVAVSSVTSDYWQGDEAKFLETYPKGAGSLHISEIEFDESSQSYQSQVSFPLVDPASNEVVGAITVGLNAEAFF